MGEYKPFAERPEWADVQPVPQDDGPEPLVKINYSPEFVDALDYFRAILVSGEVSERVLDLTYEVIEHNTANYTAYAHRRHLLAALDKDLRAELALMRELGEDNPKNYQLWFHRQACVDSLAVKEGKPDHALLHSELEFCAAMIADDGKNYHAWAYRQWLVKQFAGADGIWDSELAFTRKLLGEDPRNNSAWNHRFFLNSLRGWTDAARSDEIAFALDEATKTPNNESPYNYITGVAQGKIPDAVVDACEQLKSKSTFAMALLLEAYVERAKHSEATTLCDALVLADPIRAKYWEYRRAGIAA